MRVMLTSCGLETKKIGAAFLEFLGKAPEEVHALFIPTAALLIRRLPDEAEIIDG